MKKLIILSFIFLLSCNTGKLTAEITIQKLGPPSGTKKIADNIFYDESNVRNIDYL
jgi:hypothetical protein